MGLSLPVLTWEKVKESLQPSPPLPVLCLEHSLQSPGSAGPRPLSISPHHHQQPQAKKPISVSAGNRIPPPTQPHRLARRYLSAEGSSASLLGGSCNPRRQQGKIGPAFVKSLPCPVVTPPPCRFLLWEEGPPQGAWPRLLCSTHSFSLLYGFCQVGEWEREGEEKYFYPKWKGGVTAKNLPVDRASLGSVSSAESDSGRVTLPPHCGDEDKGCA